LGSVRQLYTGTEETKAKQAIDDTPKDGGHPCRLDTVAPELVTHVQGTEEKLLCIFAAENSGDFTQTKKLFKTVFFFGLSLAWHF